MVGQSSRTRGAHWYGDGMMLMYFRIYIVPHVCGMRVCLLGDRSVVHLPVLFGMKVLLRSHAIAYHGIFRPIMSCGDESLV